MRLRVAPWLIGSALVAVVVAVIAGGRAYMSNASRAGLAPEEQRQLAAFLAEKKAFEPALDVYDDFLAHARLGPQERAKVCFAAANVAIEAGADERALALLYQAEWLKPGGELQKEIDAKIMTCLERLGRSDDLRTALRERAQIGRARDTLQSGEAVLAELGDRVFTTRDLDAALEKLPPAARGALSAPEKKLELLKNLIAEHLLAEKARRQELDKDPQIQAMLSDQLDALMVRKLIQQEVQSKVQIAPGEVERYYEANRSRFTTPARATARVGHRAEGSNVEPSFGDEPVNVAEGGDAGTLDGGAEAVKAILALAPGDRTPGFSKGDGTETVYEVVSREPQREIAYPEVRDQLERELRMRKEQEHLQSLIQSLLQTHNVRIHEERLQEQES